jgi:hypothetical protein
MIHITLGPLRLVPSDDPLGRAHCGWQKGMSDEDCYYSNRGRWVLGNRADDEEFALFSTRDDAGQKRFRMAITIDRIEDTGEGRRAMVGRILRPGHPVYDKYVGREAPATRNPVTYIDEQEACACGCGELAAPGKDFLPGHDQRAIHERVAKVGGVRKFVDWFDTTWTP